MKFSLVNIFSGSAISVLTRPVFQGSTPKIYARLAPMRFWISAEPLRSTHSRRTVSWRTISTTTSALIAAMPISNPIPSTRSVVSVAREALDQLTRALGSEVLVVIVVHLHHRRRVTRRQALDLVE